MRKKDEGERMNALKPCPFCGGEAEINANYSEEKVFVFCKKCKSKGAVVLSCIDYSARDKAVEMWNRRMGENE